MTDKPLEISICRHAFSYSLKKPDSCDVKLYLSQNYAPDLFDAGPSGKISFPENLPKDADLIVLSEHPRGDDVLQTLQFQADQHRQIIIAPVGPLPPKGLPAEVQAIYVIAPGQPPTRTEKISFDMEDQRGAKAGTLRRGRKLHIFKTPVGRFSVLNCHDYTHSDLIDILLPEKLDFLIVCSNNTASRLFREYALSDVHHMFGYIILSNVASFGGSGVYGPIAKFSDNKVRVSTSGTLFEASGPSYATSLIPLPIKYLSGVREAYLTCDDPAKVTYGDPKTGEHKPVLPPECFTSVNPPYRTALAGENPVKPVDLDSKGYRFTGELNEVRVTIAQLFTPDMDAYHETSYRPGAVPKGKTFLSKVAAVLSEFDRRQTALGKAAADPCRDKSVPIDAKSSFLLLPEVFLPESLEDDVRALVRKHNVIVLSGLEYEKQADPSWIGTGKAKGANRSRIYIPANGGVVECTYLKMTRSQYDARWPDPSDKKINYQFEMKPGEELLRFTSATGVNFGILVCYDISHFEIISRINEEDPLDVLFVLSHNPFAELYRNICLASSHRFYQFVAMCNVATYGGSGVFGPVRTQGTRRTLAYLGQNTEAVVDVKLNIDGLRKARSTPDEKLAPGKCIFQRKPGRYQIRVKRRLDPVGE